MRDDKDSKNRNRDLRVFPLAINYRKSGSVANRVGANADSFPRATVRLRSNPEDLLDVMHLAEDVTLNSSLTRPLEQRRTSGGKPVRVGLMGQIRRCGKNSYFLPREVWRKL